MLHQVNVPRRISQRLAFAQHPTDTLTQSIFYDTLLMNSPTEREANNLNSILSDFTEALGMTLNLEKSKLFFFNTLAAVQLHISRLLGIPKSSLPSNYLGIPLT